MPPRKLVFLVDDEPLLLRAMERVVRGLPVEVRTFADPGLALRAARERPPDLVVTDLKLSAYIDGLALVAALKALGVPKALLVSGDAAAPDLAVKAIHAGQLDGFVKKPWEPGELLAEVAGLFDLALAAAPHERKR